MINQWWTTNKLKTAKNNLNKASHGGGHKDLKIAKQYMKNMMKIPIIQYMMVHIFTTARI